MQLPKSLHEIAQGAEAADSPDEVNRRMAQAAELVEDFAASTSLPTLDALIDAARSEDAKTTRALRPLAEDAVRQTEVLQDEVERFLGHMQRTARP